MNDETKAPTKEEVEEDAGKLAGYVSGIGVREDREALARLKSAALLGTQAPGLVADNAALVGLLQRVSSAGLKPSGVVVADVDATLAQPNPGAALLAEHDAEVSALQARVNALDGDLRRILQVLTLGQQVDAAQTVLGHEVLDAVRALQARVAQVEHLLGESIAETPRAQSIAHEAIQTARNATETVGRLESERDALRAQVKRARDAFGDISTTFEAKPLWGPPQDGLSSKMAKAIDYAWGVAREQYAALSAPPAETPAPGRKEVPCRGCGEPEDQHQYGARAANCPGHW
jgi:hypothetical protein